MNTSQKEGPIREGRPRGSPVSDAYDRESSVRAHTSCVPSNECANSKGAIGSHQDIAQEKPLPQRTTAHNNNNTTNSFHFSPYSSVEALSGAPVSLSASLVSGSEGEGAGTGLNGDGLRREVGGEQADRGCHAAPLEAASRTAQREKGPTCASRSRVVCVETSSIANEDCCWGVSSNYQRTLSGCSSPFSSSPSTNGGGVGRVGEYTLMRRLGDGTYGTVFLATHNRTHESFAIKRILVDKKSMSFIEKQVRREASLMQGLHHPHVVRLIQVLQTPDAFYFVMELAEGGELFDMVISSKKFSETTARKYFQQLISALQYCHSKDVIHRDLKAENLLLSRTGQLKVCDFGFSLHFKTSELGEGGEDIVDSCGSVECGTVDYMAPEYARAKGFGMRGRGHAPDADNIGDGVLDPHMHDLWAAGVILYFMLVGSLPFRSRSEEETLYKIANISPNLDLIESPGARALLAKMLASDPTDRLSIAEIIEDQWFSSGIDIAMFGDHCGRSLPHRGSSASCGGSFLLHTQNHSHGNGAANMHSSDLSQSLRYRWDGYHFANASGIAPSASSLGGQSLRKGPRMFLDFSPSPSGDAIDTLLTEAETDTIADAFSVMDVDDDGFLTRDEIRDAVLELNPNRHVPPSEMEAIVSCFLPDGQPSIDLEGFTKVWVTRDLDHTVLKNIPYFRLRNLSSLVHAPVDPSVVRTVRSVFDQIDIDHDGFFTAKDVEALIRESSSRSQLSTPSPSPSPHPSPSPCPCVVVSETLGMCKASSHQIRAQETVETGVPLVMGSAYYTPVDGGAQTWQTSALPTPDSDSLGVKELISYMDTKGSGTIIFDEFLTATARSHVLLDHRVGSQLRRVIPQMSDLRSHLLSTGARFTVSGSITSVTAHLSSHAPVRLRYVSTKSSSGVGAELLYDFTKSESPDLPPNAARQQEQSPLSRESEDIVPPVSTAPCEAGSLAVVHERETRTSSDTMGSHPCTPTPPTTPGILNEGKVCFDVGRRFVPPPAFSLHPQRPGADRARGSPHQHTGQTSFGGRLKAIDSRNASFQHSSNVRVASVIHDFPLVYGQFHHPKLPDGVLCRVSIRLTRLCEGFVGVFVTRIAGSTMDYHDTMGVIMAAIEAEREQAVHETQPVGDSELM